MSIYDELKAAGVEIDHHESDLYAKDCEATRRILGIENGKKRRNVSATRFRSQNDGSVWWDIPFMYQPYWDKRAKRAPVQA
jgi:hypothetical protein